MPESTDGKWNGVLNAPGDSVALNDGRGFFAIHAVLLKTGKVLWFSGHAETVQYLLESWVWDPTQPASTATKQPFPSSSDLFCAHMATLEDGRVLVVGGAEAAAGNGIKAISTFDPNAPNATAWEKIGDMDVGRWYPTLVALPDGSFVTFSGRRESGAPLIADTAELFEPPFEGPGYTATTLSGGDKGLPTYPSMHLVPGGRLFYTGTTWAYEGSGTTSPIKTHSFRVTSPTTAVWKDEGIFPNDRYREEGTAVLLPPAQDGKILLIGGGYYNSGSQHADARPLSAEILDTKAATLAWQPAGPMNHPRINVSAVLLPDGKVLVIGGHNFYKWNSGSTPSNQAEIYDPVTDTWTPVASMGASRTYHSVALLLSDGRVAVGGGVDPTNAEPNQPADEPRALNQKTVQVYEPPYFFNGAQPTLGAVTRDDGPDGEIAYGRHFNIESPNAADIVRVVLMRPGAITHHTDSEQRYVPLNFVVTGANSLRAAAVNDPTVAPPGYYMLWIVDSSGLPCQVAKFVQLVRRNCFIITDRSHFSNDEVAPAPAPTDFPESLYVVMDGFRPEELGITTPIPADLSTIAPALTFIRGGAPEATISAAPAQLLLEDNALPPGKRQRFTFKYTVTFAGNAAFFQADGTTPIELQPVIVRATKGEYTCEDDITLTHQPNPYMLDGSTHWLSVDVRVFQIEQGQSRFGLTVGATSNAATDFIQDALSQLNADPTAGRASFEDISTDPQASVLELARAPGGTPIYNFAVAQVRYRGRTLDAADVRVFFRGFRTTATGFAYQPATTYRREINAAGDPIPVLGLSGGEIVTMPFFAEPRVNTALQPLTAQTDPTNTRTINATGGSETTAYFGCWLDYNQTALRFPLSPGNPTGPWATGLKSIQELVRGAHQCLVAEVHFTSDPINTGDTPAGNDNLSQRNLALVESDNPGSPATHTVQHTFEVNPSLDMTPATPATLVAVAGGEFGTAATKIPGPYVPGNDELMIRWGNLPRESRATLYLPDIDLDEVMALNARRIGVPRLIRADADTLECPVGDVTYIPLPGDRSSAIPGLLSIELPSGVKRGNRFTVILQQVSYPARQVLGAFEVFINVTTASLLLPKELKRLAVFRHILTTIPLADRWRPIIEHYVDQMADRVRGFGADPDIVEPSPDGAITTQVSQTRCRRHAWAVAVLLALFIVTLGLTASTITNLLRILSGLGFAGAFITWKRYCRPDTCSLLRWLAGGTTIGLGALGLLAAAGFGGAGVFAVIGLSGTAAAILIILSILRRC